MQKRDRILTLHPQGKRGVNIEKEKYRIVRDAIIGVLSASFPTVVEIRFPQALMSSPQRLKPWWRRATRSLS